MDQTFFVSNYSVSTGFKKEETESYKKIWLKRIYEKKLGITKFVEKNLVKTKKGDYE